MKKKSLWMKGLAFAMAFSLVLSGNITSISAAENQPAGTEQTEMQSEETQAAQTQSAESQQQADGENQGEAATGGQATGTGGQATGTAGQAAATAGQAAATGGQAAATGGQTSDETAGSDRNNGESTGTETSGEVTTGGEEITEEANAGAEGIDTEIIAETEETVGADEDIASGVDGALTWVIDADGKLTVNGDGDCAGSKPEWLEYASKIKSADINVTGTTDMRCWFRDCTILQDIDFADTDTSNVIDMCAMFERCQNLQTLDLHNFNTSKLKYASEMFMDCYSLQTLDLSSFDTSNVIGMSWMFFYCKNLQTLNLSSFDTSNVVDMTGLFGGCSNLQTLDLSSFDTSKVGTMNSMFFSCSGLQALDLSSFDTSNVSDMNEMFCDCSGLQTLNLSSFDTFYVDDMGNMFDDCSSLQTLDLSSFDTARAIYMNGMFHGCSSLQTLDLSSFDMSNVNNMCFMFENCTDLRTSITLSGSQWYEDNGYSNCFLNAATADNAEIIVKYNGSCTYDMAEALVNTKSTGSHVSIYEERPGTPADFSVSTGSEFNTITFTGSENVTGYEIYRAGEENGEYTLIATITDPAASSYVDYEKNETNTAYYRMRAYSVNGNNETFYSDFTEPAEIIGTSPEIITQPIRERVLVGDEAAFSVIAAGQGLTYLWQYSENGGNTWIDTTDTEACYEITASLDMNGRIFRCRITSANGTSITSEQAVLMVYSEENSEAYIAMDGSLYATWEEVPCGTTYTHYYIDGEGTDVSTVEEKNHSYVEEYYDKDGNEVDPDSDLPCGQYNKYSVCQYCGKRKLLGAKTVYHDMESSYITEDGTVYDTYSEIPYHTEYTECQTCSKCGAVTILEESSMKRPSGYTYTVFYAAEDGTRYQNYSDIPCGTYYVWGKECSETGEEYLIGTEYMDHSYSKTYYTQDGTECTDLSGLPCGTYVTVKATCSVCGEEYEEGYYKQHSYMSMPIATFSADKCTMTDGETKFDGEIPCGTDYMLTYTCTNCGDTYTKVLHKDHQFTANVTLTGEDGTVYLNEDQIPCGTRYTKTADCYWCGEHMEESLVRNHSFSSEKRRNSYSLTDEDGNNYTVIYSSGLGCYVYQSADGIGESGYSYPSCQTLTEEGTCVLCGQTFSRTFENHSWLEQEDGTYACTNCGLVKDDCDFYRNAAEITAQPENTIVEAGEKFTFKVEAAGEGLTYLWQYSKDKGATWINTTRTRNNYGTTATTAMTGRRFRCLITDANGNTLISDSAILKVCRVGYQEEYIDADGTVYISWDDIPCGTTCTHYYLDDEGKESSGTETKDHSYVDGYFDKEGNEVDPDSDLPCGQYTKYSVCQNCGERKLLGAKTVGHAYSDYHYIAEDGTLYDNYDDIPYNTTYTYYWICMECGAALCGQTSTKYESDVIRTWVYVTEDGTEYQNYSDIPCESSYKYIMKLSGGEEDVIGIQYKSHSYEMTYYNPDGTECTDFYSIPCGTYVTEKGTCTDCGAEFEGGYYKEHEYKSMSADPYLAEKCTMVDGESSFDGEIPCGAEYIATYICENCGDQYTEVACMEHVFNTNVTLTGEDGTVYHSEYDIPCGTTYTKSADCNKCGEHMEEVLVREHCFAYGGWDDTQRYSDHIITDQDGNQYQAIYQSGVVAFMYCPLSDEGKMGKIMWMPVCQTLTEEGTCVLCGENFSRTFETHEWMEQEDGTYVCANCGMAKEDCELYKKVFEITAQPKDTSVVVGEKFTFKVEAAGEGMTYLWQYSTDHGETWTDTTRTKDNYGTTAKTAMDGRMFRCLVTNEDGNTLTSDSALLTVKPLIEITSQPEAATVNVGDLYRFKVTAVSNIGSTLTYLWQYSKNKTTWTDTTRTLNNYGTYATYGMDGRYFRCQITDAEGNVTYSDPAFLRVQGEITITEQPADQTVAAGDKFIFQVTATGASLTYLWQYSTDGGTTWTDTTRTKNNYTTYAKKAMNGRMYRCVITDSSNNSVTSEAGTLTVN